MKYFFTSITAIVALLLSYIPGIKLQSRSTWSQPRHLKKRSLRSFFQSSHWLRFKKFWRKIGHISPKKKSRRLSIMHAPYASAITLAEHKKYMAQLKQHIEGLNLSPLEKNLFSSIVQERLNNMYIGPRSMFTRMMPSPSIIEKEKSLQRIEKTIDLLIKLRSQRKINSREFKQAIRSVKQDILAVSVIKIISKIYGSYWYLPHTLVPKQKRISIITRQLIMIERHYHRYLKREQTNPKLFNSETAKKLAKKLTQVKKELRAIRTALPRFMTMLEELEK